LDAAAKEGAKVVFAIGFEFNDMPYATTDRALAGRASPR
jgi:hypothetical protein